MEVVITIEGLEYDREIYNEEGELVYPYKKIDRVLPEYLMCPSCKGMGNCSSCGGSGRIKACFSGRVVDGVYNLKKGRYKLVVRKDGVVVREYWFVVR